MEAKITVELWESKIQAGPFCDWESAKSAVKKQNKIAGVGVEEHDLPPLPDYFSCYAIERMNTSKMTEIERIRKKCFYVSCTKLMLHYYYLHINSHLTVNVKIVRMEH